MIMENQDEIIQEEVDEVESEIVEHDKEDQDTTDWKAKHDELLGRLKRAETKLEKSKIEKKAEEIVKEKQGELDETQLDFLDLKGITDQEEIDIIHKVMLRTGQTVRQALKDDYVVAKLEALKKNREVKDATPSSTKRGGGQTNDVETAYAKWEATGKLPDDYTLRSAVVNRIEEKSSTNKPAWQK